MIEDEKGLRDEGEVRIEGWRQHETGIFRKMHRRALLISMLKQVEEQ